MDIETLYSDPDYLAVAKPPGIAVHEAPGPAGNLLRELRERHGIGRLTPVHRLDKDVSGILLLARSKRAASALQKRWDEVSKTYLALCDGIPDPASGAIAAPILEHQTSRPRRMEVALRYYREGHPGVEVPPPPAPKTSAVHPAGRESRTEYRTIEPFAAGARAGASRSLAQSWSLLEVRPRQGRMHQIRVHLAFLGHPVAVDRMYGKRARLTERDLFADGGERVVLERMSLHASRLEFPHPREDGRRVAIEAPLPADMAEALRLMRM